MGKFRDMIINEAESEVVIMDASIVYKNSILDVVKKVKNGCVVICRSNKDELICIIGSSNGKTQTEILDGYGLTKGMYLKHKIDTGMKTIPSKMKLSIIDALPIINGSISTNEWDEEDFKYYVFK